MTLANAFEQFRTGEYMIEMILAGIDAFAEFVREKAKDEGLQREHISLLVALLDMFRKEKLEELGSKSAMLERVKR
jgi:hypothetical protein